MKNRRDRADKNSFKVRNAARAKPKKVSRRQRKKLAKKRERLGNGFLLVMTLIDRYL
ncbi:MAG: hypothetical protein IJ137_01500 [Eubacterium sp.]|nr:hypothetical protein [Eubacterium sp.]